MEHPECTGNGCASGAQLGVLSGAPPQDSDSDPPLSKVVIGNLDKDMESRLMTQNQEGRLIWKITESRFIKILAGMMGLIVTR